MKNAGEFLKTAFSMIIDKPKEGTDGATKFSLKRVGSIIGSTAIVSFGMDRLTSGTGEPFHNIILIGIGAALFFGMSWLTNKYEAKA